MVGDVFFVGYILGFINIMVKRQKGEVWRRGRYIGEYQDVKYLLMLIIFGFRLLLEYYNVGLVLVNIGQEWREFFYRFQGL